jgi:hypothetical protein
MGTRTLGFALLSLLFFSPAVDADFPFQQNTAKTDLPGKGPCTKIPDRYQKIEVRLAWFYGCMHQDPPTIAEIKAKIAALPPEKRAALESKDFITQEALLAVAFGDAPIQIFPK